MEYELLLRNYESFGERIKSYFNDRHLPLLFIIYTDISMESGSWLPHKYKAAQLFFYL